MGELVASELEPLYSSLGADPDLAELVAMFVDEIAGRVGRMRDCLDAGDTDGLRRAAHQLKGAAGSYGFFQLTPPTGGPSSGFSEHMIIATAASIMARRTPGTIPAMKRRPIDVSERTP